MEISPDVFELLLQCDNKVICYHLHVGADGRRWSTWNANYVMEECLLVDTHMARCFFAFTWGPIINIIYIIEMKILRPGLHNALCSIHNHSDNLGIGIRQSKINSNRKAFPTLCRHYWRAFQLHVQQTWIRTRNLLKPGDACLRQ